VAIQAGAREALATEHRNALPAAHSPEDRNALMPEAIPEDQNGVLAAGHPAIVRGHLGTTETATGTAPIAVDSSSSRSLVILFLLILIAPHAHGPSGEQSVRCGKAFPLFPGRSSRPSDGRSWPFTGVRNSVDQTLPVVRNLALAVRSATMRRRRAGETVPLFWDTEAPS
jgi:hypothetical protein